VRKQRKRRSRNSESVNTSLPPLPRHPPRGIPISAGDKVELREFTIDVKDLSPGKLTLSALRMGVPESSEDLSCGATFRVRQTVEPTAIALDNGRVRLCEGQDTIDVSLRHTSTDPFAACYQAAQRSLDAIAVERCQFTELHDPLREHCVWFKEAGKIVLRFASTLSVAIHARMNVVAFAPDGTIRTQSQPPISWHASHAYFRRSQTTDDLHEAYRNLFLALEALLSDVYPWQPGMGEGRWLKHALKHVIEGYGLDLSRYLVGSGSDCYQLFLEEQYNAQRCALFHAKASASPSIPSDESKRLELAAATDRIGKLYTELARLITGAAFASEDIMPAARKAIAERLSLATSYVSSEEQFDAATTVRAPLQLTQSTLGAPNLWVFKGRWGKERLPTSPLRRLGSILTKEDGSESESLHSRVHIDTSRVDIFEFAVQLEILNAAALRNRYL
jgi:hypothetical protein